MRGVGLEATVETFDSGLQPQELPESATAAGIQAAVPATDFTGDSSLSSEIGFIEFDCFEESMMHSIPLNLGTARVVFALLISFKMFFLAYFIPSMSVSQAMARAQRDS